MSSHWVIGNELCFPSGNLKIEVAGGSLVLALTSVEKKSLVSSEVMLRKFFLLQEKG